jgi:hypothetical protein
MEEHRSAEGWSTRPDPASGPDTGLQLAGHAPVAPGVAPPAPGRLVAELESMRDFKKRVDRLWHELDGSQARPGSLREDHVEEAAFGTEFDEATTLHSAYTYVHDQLASLSGLLSGQITALSTAIEGARSGYENVDLDARDQMWSVQTETQQHAHHPGGGEGTDAGRNEPGGKGKATF